MAVLSGTGTPAQWIQRAFYYDPLGRPRTATSGTGSGAVTTTDTYNIQGWLTARTAQRSGGTNIFSMNLGYYSPVQSGAAARYSGDISSWTWTQYGQGQKAYAYTYDGAHRLTAGQYYSGGSATNALSEKAISYDRAGNITALTRYSSSGSATTLSYSYTGNRRSTFAYDINGNVTNDATNSLQTSYNLINLPAQTKSGSTVKANYSYLSDGAKASVLNASGTGYDYNGTFTYSHASGGTRTLESVAFGGGRIRKNGSTYAVDYYVTDHLGSVRAIVNASGAIVEQNDFYPFGTRQQNGLTPLSANRWRFSGKEGYDGAFGIALDDFGARRYDRTAWTSIDPLAEKYYSISPYAYCAGNPVAVIDDGGKDLILVGVNNSSVSFKTNLIDLSVNIGKLGVDWKGNYSFEGDELLGAALDVAGIFDPTGIADIANAKLQLDNGDKIGAAISAIGLIPYAGDLAKTARIGKDVKTISNAIDEVTFTSRNFRKNLSKLTGAPAEGMQAHHTLPQKFRLYFQSAGINTDNPKYGRWLESTKHNKGSYKYNRKWDDFRKEHPKPSEEEILDQIEVFMKEVYGE